MPYRKSPPPDPGREKKEKELAALRSLALEGEAQEKMSALRAKEREERLAARKKARAAFFKGLSRLLFGSTSSYYRGAVQGNWLIPVYMLTAVASYFVCIGVLAEEQIPLYIEIPLRIPPLGVFLFVVLLFPLYRIATWLLLWREDLRLARLPFPLHRYKELLSEEPQSSSAALRIDIRFQEDLPKDPALFGGLFALLKDKEISYHQEDSLLTITSGKLQLHFRGKGGTSKDTGQIRKYFWKAHRRVLMPLHKTFTIEELSLSLH